MEKITSFIVVLSLVGIVQGKIDLQFDILVAADGSGDFNTISHAVNAAPNYSKEKYSIKIKAGIYTENIQIGEEKTNLVFIGDGMNTTIITGSRSHGTGYATFKTATVDIIGDGFIAKYITFENSAGQRNEQAVAMKSSSRFSAFYQCRFKGYQDTLYVHMGIQFYKECEIFGTIDIIFGNAKVVFQNCGIFVHNPGQGHSNVITAQGRNNSGDITGISIHNCKIMAAKDFSPNARLKTYLGRPWRPFSTVVIMQSFLDYIIDPEGWLKWDDDISVLTTLYYGEYQNKGPGANTAKRVNWTGYRVMSLVEAEKFTVRNFINGLAWLSPTKIPFSLDLI